MNPKPFLESNHLTFPVGMVVLPGIPERPDARGLLPLPASASRMVVLPLR